MRQGRSMEYEDMISRIKYYINRKQDFFVGGRGVGFSCHTNAIGWKIEVERAALVIYTAKIELEEDGLMFYGEGKEQSVGEFDLRHYLKVQAI